MKIQEFINQIDEIAEKEGFKNQFLILVANKKGKLSQWVHVYNHDTKRCKIIDNIVRKLTGNSLVVKD